MEGLSPSAKEGRVRARAPGRIGNRIGEEIERRTGHETRGCPRHVQWRIADRLSTARWSDALLAAFAADLVARREFGKMAALQGTIVAVTELSDARDEAQDLSTPWSLQIGRCSFGQITPSGIVGGEGAAISTRRGCPPIRDDASDAVVVQAVVERKAARGFADPARRRFIQRHGEDGRAVGGAQCVFTDRTRSSSSSATRSTSPQLAAVGCARASGSWRSSIARVPAVGAHALRRSVINVPGQAPYQR